MKQKDKATLSEFYLKSFFTGWGICCLVWLFMLIQFWWGNHDWGYLKSGTDISSGLFEARYSQHLPTFLLFDKHILPFLTLFCAISCMVLEAMFIAIYLDIPKSYKNYLFLMLLMCLNPYTATLFYFLYLSFVYVFWSIVGIVLLFIAERRGCWYNVLSGAVLFFLILGSYPPNIALVLVLYAAKRFFQYLDNKETLTVVVKKSLYFLIMLGLGYVIFNLLYKFILASGYISTTMYNIAVKNVLDIGLSLWNELGHSVLQLFHQYSFMHVFYCFLMLLLISVAVLKCFAYKKNKVLVGLFVVAVFLASRVCFIVGAEVSAGVFRMEYWSRMALALFAIAVLLRSKNKFVSNFLLVWGVVTFFLFIRTDLDIQKVRYLEFAANRKYQARRVDAIVTHPAFEMAPKYISLNFGYPVFHPKYMEPNRSGDIAGVMAVFDFDGINQLFWEEKTTPVVIGTAVWGQGKIFKSNRGDIEKWADSNYWRNNPENMENIKYWLYTDAGYNKAYVDDKYIVTIFDMGYFYKYREMVVNHLDE